MMYRELNYNPSIFDKRIKEIEKEIEHTGTYTHTLEELSYGAKLAWRNSNRCIGRLFWDSLNVEDARNVDNERDFIDTINHHLEHATNNGKIKPYITIFSPNQAPRIYNNQLIRYAGYEHAGDPSEREITQLAEHLGWKGKGTDFDVLPLIYQLPNDSIKWYELPNELIKEVEIEHEHYPKIKRFKFKMVWCSNHF